MFRDENKQEKSIKAYLGVLNYTMETVWGVLCDCVRDLLT